MAERERARSLAREDDYSRAAPREPYLRELYLRLAGAPRVSVPRALPSSAVASTTHAGALAPHARATVQARAGAKAASAAVRNAAGEQIGARWAGTACWHPPRPSMLASVGADGGETTLACRDCPGCRQLQRQILARDRLREFYARDSDSHSRGCADLPASHARQLAVVEVRAAPGKSVDRIILRVRLATRPGRPGAAAHGAIRGWTRAAAGAVRVLVDGAKAARIIQRLARERGAARADVRMVKRRRGAYIIRSFARLTAGILTPRDEYGAWANRFYFRGLPAAPAERREIVMRGGIAQRHGIESARAWAIRAWRGGVTIELPETVSVRMRKPRSDAQDRGRIERRRMRRMNIAPSRAGGVFSALLKRLRT